MPYKNTQAQKKSVKISRKLIPQKNKRLTAIVMDATTGQLLYEENANSLRCPASTIKLLTVYIVFSELKRGKLHFTDQLKISQHAAQQKPTKLGLKAGQTISVRDALLGALTKSANDAAVVLGEAIAGSEKKFTELMNRTAQKLGLTKTVCINASGWPDTPQGFVDRRQVTTAVDIAKLSRLLMKDFPQYYKFFSTQKFVYRGTTFPNYNSLLKKKKGVDGLKTGYGGGAVGFNLSASEKRGNMRVIAVVLGARTPLERNQKTSALLDKGFEILEKKSKNISSKKQISPETKSFPEEDVFDLEDLQEIFEEAPPSSEKDLSPEFEKQLCSLLDNPKSSHCLQKTPLKKDQKVVPLKKSEEPSSFEARLSEALERDEKEVLDAIEEFSTKEKPLKKASLKDTKKSLAKKTLKDSPFGKTQDLPSFETSQSEPQAQKNITRSSSKKEKSIDSKKWSIQIATLPSSSKAKEEGKRLAQTYPSFLKVNRLRVLKTEKKGSKKNFSIRFIGLSKKEALKACRTLRAQKENCRVIEP
ncbi:MAG: D-alanyl-D-alanine carboxypeptidase [Proteobacteria bacterium]|nr:D-alanyl-D-alanine carboxypeptidase [Pseudomonadota bacterium]